MVKEELAFLTRIYNTLLDVSTRGDDTIIMGDCLKSLRNFILTEKDKLDKEEE